MGDSSTGLVKGPRQTKETKGGEIHKQGVGEGGSDTGATTSHTHTFSGSYNYSGCTSYSGNKSQTLPSTNPTQSDVITLDPIHYVACTTHSQSVHNLGLYNTFSGSNTNPDTLLRLFKPKVSERLL